MNALRRLIDALGWTAPSGPGGAPPTPTPTPRPPPSAQALAVQRWQTEIDARLRALTAERDLYQAQRRREG